MPSEIVSILRTVVNERRHKASQRVEHWSRVAKDEQEEGNHDAASIARAKTRAWAQVESEMIVLLNEFDQVIEHYQEPEPEPTEVPSDPDHPGYR